jgi:hypothetical protein
MTAALQGRIDWNSSRDKEGHRDFKIRWLVKADVEDGPGIVMATPGLPEIGAPWAYGNDDEQWALCWPTMTVKMLKTKEPGEFWTVDQMFSTRPLKRCQDDSIENPLNEPDRVSGSFVKYLEEISKDRNGDAIKSSSHEMIRGAIVEFDNNRPMVNIEKTLLILPLSTFAPMVDTVNDAPLWGLLERMIKLDNVSWSRLLYGTCNFYYTVGYEFGIDYKTFDRVAMDEGTKCLIGWAPGSDAAQVAAIPGGNPITDFEVYKDVNGENTRCVLDGTGKPVLAADGQPAEIDIEYYAESNLLSLGIPTVF